MPVMADSIMIKRTNLFAALLAASACTVINAGNADAVLVFDLIQQGPDIQFNVSGSLSGLPSPTGTNGTASCFGGNRYVNSGAGNICTIGTVAFVNTYPISLTGSTAAFGTNSSLKLLSSYSGVSLVLFAGGNELYLPTGYTNGNSISGSG